MANDKPDARSAARWTAVGILLAAIVAVVIVDLADGTRKAWELSKDRKEEFELFAAYFIAATAIERLMEVMSGWFPFKQETEPTDPKQVPAFRAQRSADRGVIVAAAAAAAGMAASAVGGLYFMRAVGATPPLWADMAMTGLLLGGGTKTVHELLRVIQKARTGATGDSGAAPAPAAGGATPAAGGATPAAGGATPPGGGAPPAV